MRRLVDRLRTATGCEVHAPNGAAARVRDVERVPADLAEFYSLCSGASLHQGADYGISIVDAGRFVPANPVILGADPMDDISRHWYVVGHDGGSQYLTIDCHPNRLGRCYDSFWDSHGVAGSCAIVAASFTELLVRLMDGEGQGWYWLRPEWNGYGDAYDATPVAKSAGVEFVACPRCEQDWIREVTLTALGTRAYLCVECDAMWLSRDQISQETFVDYSTFMEAHGRSSPEDPREIQLGEKLTRSA